VRAQALAPFLFVIAWVCLAVLWHDPTFQRAGRARAFARIVHTLGSTEPETGAPARTYRLAPIVPRPGRTRAEVRAELGVPDGQPLAAVYLNPHFRDPSIATSLEEGLGRRGFRPYAVGEGSRGRPGWVPRSWWETPISPPRSPSPPGRCRSAAAVPPCGPRGAVGPRLRGAAPRHALGPGVP